MRMLQIMANMLLHCHPSHICVPPVHPHEPARIVISGTKTARDLIMDDLDIRTKAWPPSSTHKGVVHRGFARRTKSLLKDMEEFLDGHDSFVISGHSMGGACAVLLASELICRSKAVVAVYTFGTPHMSMPSFTDIYKAQGLCNITEHYTTPLDPVVHKIPYVYEMVGPYCLLECDKPKPWDHHNMDSYVDALKIMAEL